MSRIGLGLGGLLVLLGLVGCQSSDAHLRPPKKPEEYVLPPDDKHFQLPPDYPRSGGLTDTVPTPTKGRPGAGEVGNPSGGAARPGMRQPGVAAPGGGQTSVLD